MAGAKNHRKAEKTAKGESKRKKYLGPSENPKRIPYT